ncbi:Ribosomal protein L7/L12 C-terminal domain-containing protein [Amycolatopsis pretoriensis]|uniref:Ribosomal protein L7/L12 C-terminal domain-containing protein n=1 Tax=Amycolatopsis pretoriensis TaxID=218821 RepID=A0A1H5QM58_9PSEU|nr:Ribosomal protein L7/L12 C-terminal domain-containing protein [Amycolatopsis pretoriensis]
MRSATTAREIWRTASSRSFGGLRLTGTAVVEGAGDRALRHSLTGLSARVEIRSARTGRVTVPRVPFLGILALAVKKEQYDTEVNLVIEGRGTRLERAVSLRKHPDGADVAREFAEQLNHLNAHPASNRREQSRPRGGQERFDVALLNAGARQVEVVRAVRHLVRGIGLIDAKELVTGTPSNCCGPQSATRRNRGTTPPAVSTGSVNIASGRTHSPRAPYSARYTTSRSSVSLWRATPMTSYSPPL